MDLVSGAQPQKYMAVPEKIELSGNSGLVGYPMTSHPPSDRPRYQVMKVPDTITLGEKPFPFGGSGGATEEFSVGGSERDIAAISKVRMITESDIMQKQSQPKDFPVEQAIPPRNSGESNTSIPDIEHRIKNLENKVQRLTETVLSRQDNFGRTQSGSDGGGNGFWYVVTFAGWMMIPLIVVFMYRYK